MPEGDPVDPGELALKRVVIAAAASGQGKTTIAVGIMAALTRSGLIVSPGKVGPDYIDPGYHALATGRPGRNLDPWLVGEQRVAGLLRHAACTPEPADIAIIEGVMGIFDGRLGTDGFASTAHVARLTASPVVLVLDTSSASRTIAATVAGIGVLAPELDIAGVILNKVGSPRHTAEVSRAVEAAGAQVIGVLPRDAGISAPSRHLGLVPVAERPDAAARLDRLAAQVAEFVDLTALQQIAATAPPIDSEPWHPGTPVGSGQRPVVAIAGGRAFTFRYAETDEMLRGLGCEPVVFDPAVDTELPAGTRGLYLGGGFPEIHATTLESNHSLLAEVREAVASGMPTVAECAGMLYLCRAVDGHSFVGAVPADAAMHPRLKLGYREAELAADSVLGCVGTSVRGHEFHRTRTTPEHGDRSAWLIAGEPEGFVLDPAGTGRGTVHASYLHTHWAGNPGLAANFADAVLAFDATLPSGSSPVGDGPGCRVLPDERVDLSSDEMACSIQAASSGESLAGEDVGSVGSAAQESVELGSHHHGDAGLVGPLGRHGDAGLVGPLAHHGDAGLVDPLAHHGDAGLVDPLAHHGDAELADGLANFAVNVRLDGPPPWLARVINETTGRLGAYPDAAKARDALAKRHGVAPEMVLPTAGAAEAFTLVALAFSGRATVIHPQFTEPEAALRRVGRDVVRHILPGPPPSDERLSAGRIGHAEGTGWVRASAGRRTNASAGNRDTADRYCQSDRYFRSKESFRRKAYRLDPEQVPRSELLIVGNPTNPTGVLHPAADLRSLPTDVLVVDEAFMDAVPGEPETLISADMTGVIVLRSLTKTWGLAGVRAGYVVGDPKLIAAMSAHQTPWSVGTHALKVMEATATPAGCAEAAEAAAAYEIWREHLVRGLAELGIETISGVAPFVLARTGPGIHGLLRGRGVAVRRADTFPGLDDTWIRIALRDPHTTDSLLRELRGVLRENRVLKENHDW